MSTDTINAPDVDRVIHYSPSWSGTTARCRMRAWWAHHVVVVSELDDNPGASVTNAIEAVAAVVDAQLAISMHADHAWQLVEHYPKNSPSDRLHPTIDLVAFADHALHDGRYARPTWRRLSRSDSRLGWLFDAVGREGDVNDTSGEGA